MWTSGWVRDGVEILQGELGGKSLCAEVVSKLRCEGVVGNDTDRGSRGLGVELREGMRNTTSAGAYRDPTRGERG